MMSEYQSTFTERLNREIAQTPDEYLPMLLQIVSLFRQCIALKPADDSFRQGWKEAMAGEKLPIEDLWSGIEK